MVYRLFDRGDAPSCITAQTLKRERSILSSVPHRSATERLSAVRSQAHRDEGEFIPGQLVNLAGDPTRSIGGDRLDLTLGHDQESMICTAASANARTVVAVVAGSAVMMEAWRQEAGAILMLWYPGMAGGHALADVLFGRVNPSGHLPFTIPRRVEDLPFFDLDAKAITYDRWHGYTKLEHDEVTPAWPFGFGLSYTRFEIAVPLIGVDDATRRMRVDVDVTNTGIAEAATGLDSQTLARASRLDLLDSALHAPPKAVWSISSSTPSSRRKQRCSSSTLPATIRYPMEIR